MSIIALFLKRKNLFNLWVALLAIGLLGFIASEAHWNFAQPTEENKTELIENALNDASIAFKDEEYVFLSDTEKLLNSMIPVFEIENNETLVYNRLKNEKKFWGMSVFKNGKVLAWAGIPEMSVPGAIESDIYVDVKVTEYVTYFIGKVTHFSESNRYDLVTTKLLSRSGATPQLLTEQINIPLKWADQQKYPVSFNFIDGELSGLQAFSKELTTKSGHKVGYVTASSADFRALSRVWHQSMIWYRYSFLLFGLMLIYSLLLLLLSNSEFKYRWLFSALITFGIWLIMYSVGIPIPRLILSGTSTGTVIILELIRETITVLLLGIFVYKHFSEFSTEQPKKRSQLFFSIILWSSLFGLSSYWVIDKIYTTVNSTQTGILSLQILPTFETWVVYFSCLVMVGGLILLLVQFVRVLRNENAQITTSILFSFFFVLGYVLRYWSADGLFYWIYFSIIIIFILFLTSFFGLFEKIMQAPKPRIISGIVFLIVIFSSPQIFKAEIELENYEMKRMAVNFASSDGTQAETISRQLLQNLASDPIIQQIQNIDVAPTFPIYEAAQFRSRINDYILPEWESYSIMAFLLDGRLNIITDFGSQTAFSDRFSSSFHDEVKNFIRNSLRRPFARLPIIENDTRFTGFPVFVKGLQSIPSDFPTQPSWIVTFVLVEGNTFGRPLNDALAFQERDKENWGRFIVSEYVDGYLLRTASAPRAPVYPIQYLNNVWYNEPFVIEKSRENIPIRRVVHSTEQGNTVISTVRDQTLLNFIFSGFRFYASLLVVLLAFYHLYKLIRYNNEKKKPKQKLHNRILDSYLLATLLFLISLALVTEFIVTRQNVRIAEQELSGNLNTIEKQFQSGVNASAILAGLNRDLDVMIFSENRLVGSTTTEVFDLKLLSSYLPFQTYYNIFKNNLSSYYERVNVGNLPVLMGYRAIVREGNVQHVVGVPAYIRSAAFEEEFLQTTSYLIAFYIIIFMFFTGGAWLVSRRLTQPLEEFQKGLRQISSGNLDTRINVSSNDEIGELATAYNQMIADLKNLREELAVAEREAAWSEMAQQVAHEIKNPLTPMKLKIQHLQMRLSSSNFDVEEMKPEIQKLNTLLIQQIESLDTIASQFSKFAKPLTGIFKKKSPLNLVVHAVQLFDETTHVSISIDTNDELPKIDVIEDEIHRVFINLIKNAIEATQNGGHIQINITKKADYVVFSFEDSGDGISSDDLKHIFKPNFSTKTSGTGLGLAISRKIVEAHKGTIQVRSNLGKGSIFEISLPIEQIHQG